MARTVFKREARAKKELFQDGSFFKGMYYTNNLVDTATSRLLLNYTLKDNGGILNPRMGVSMSQNKEIKTLPRPYTSDTIVAGPHVKYFGVYRDTDGLDKFGNIVLSFGVPDHPGYKSYYTNSKEVDSTYYEQVYTNNGTAFGFITDVDGKSHPLDVSKLGDTRLRFYNETPKPLYTIRANKLYIVDGQASTSSGTQDYVVNGSFSRYSSFQYDGSLTSLKITPKGMDVPEFQIDTYNSKGERTGGLVSPITLHHLDANGVSDILDYDTGYINQRIRQIISDGFFQNAEVVNGSFISFLKVPKPELGLFTGTVEEVGYRTSNFTSHTEANVTDLNVFDNMSYIGYYSVRLDPDFIYIGIPLDTTLQDILLEFESTVFRYELTEPELFPLDKNEPLVVSDGGYLMFTNVSSSFPLVANYTIRYKRPIYSYSGGLVELQVFNTAEGFVLEPFPIAAKEITLSEATSVGFNMLSSNPYIFQNTTGNVLRPIGIMPYVPNSSRKISMSANMGEDINFEVFYEYIQGTRYFVKWEYLGVGVGEANIEPIVLQDYGTTSVLGGSTISRVIRANDKRFSLRVTIAPAKNGAPDETLAKVITYPVYETGNQYIKDISDSSYDLHNATGLGSYRNMLVVWGVKGAETTLFFSDYDDPSYFPFPNNIISFNHKILATQSYQGGLLVFTTSSIYLIEGVAPEEFIVTELYQGLNFDKEDLESLIVHKNIIYFRSGSNFYTLTPNTYTGQLSDIRLTNVSAPIKELVSDWFPFLRFLGDEVFGWELSFTYNTKYKIYDFFNFIDDSKIKNVYRFVLYEKIGNNYHRYQVDIVLVYNTSNGTWTTETLNLPWNDILATSSGIYSSYARGFGENSMKMYFQELDYKQYNRVDSYNTMVYGVADNDTVTSAREDDLQALPTTIEDTVVRIIDGDTLELENLGSTRLLYINTPEYTTTHEGFGAETTEYLSQLCPVGSTVRVEFEGDRSDHYDRALVWLFNDKDEFVQAKMAEFGGVKSVYSYGANRYAEALDELIQEAVDNRVGLWAFTEGEPQYIYTTETEYLLPNYQVFDTGNKNHDPYLQKRFREFQFQIINRSEDVLNFFNRFYLEGIPRQDFRSYEIHSDTDRNSKDYGTLTVVPIDESNLSITTPTYLNTWQLGVNMFPEIDTMKVRFTIAGKGRYGRMLMISKNQANYDLLSYGWVMRVMNYK